MENQLQVIVKESGLEPTKAKYILEQFQNYFEIADEWTIKAQTIVVINESQTADMEMARVGRLFLREKRIAVENVRKNLKEQSLREGKAIDGIANILKALIVPIEEYLEHQEKFVEIREETKREARRLEVEARIAEEERIAAEKAAAEQERLRVENEKLKAKAQKKEREFLAERKKQNDILIAERTKAEEERMEVARKAKIESDKQAKKLATEREKANAEREEAEERARVLKEKERIKLEAERKEKERLAEILKNQIECPFCHKKFQLKKG